MAVAKKKNNKKNNILVYHSVLLQVELQRLNVVVKPQCGHGKEYVVSCDRLSLLLSAFVTSSERYRVKEILELHKV